MLFLSPSQTNEGTAAPGCACSWLSSRGWASPSELPGKAGGSRLSPGSGRTRLSGYAQLAFQFARSGALVCPVSGSQHSEQSSGLALGGWVMASAGRINICAIVGAVLWFWIVCGGVNCWSLREGQRTSVWTVFYILETGKMIQIHMHMVTFKYAELHASGLAAFLRLVGSRQLFGRGGSILF